MHLKFWRWAHIAPEHALLLQLVIANTDEAVKSESADRYGLFIVRVGPESTGSEATMATTNTKRRA
jgi:hypothetical protein